MAKQPGAPATTAPRRRGRRAAGLVVAGLLGLVVGVGAYLGYGLATAPRPGAAPGWTTLVSMPEPRGETAVAVTADGRLYVVGGLTGFDFGSSDAVSILDAGTEAWAAGPPLPEPRHHAAAAAIEGAVYVSGGASSLGDGAPRPEVWVLGSGSDAWEPVAPLPVGRFGHRMVEVDGLLYVVGGVSGAPTTGDEELEPEAVLVYDPIAAAWSPGAPIPVARDHLAVVVVDGEIWAIGGRSGGRNHVRTDIYDPATDTWRAGPPLPEPASGAAECAVQGRIILSGGEDPAQGVMVDRHWILDARAGDAGASEVAAWLPLAPPPLTVHGAPGAALQGRCVIAGGSARPGGQSNTAWSGLTQVLVELP